MENHDTLRYIIHQYDFNLEFARSLVADLTEEQMTVIPAAGLVNHPAFTLGHLVTGSAMMIEDLGGEYIIPEGWNELFLRKGPGDPTLPNKDTNKYPSKMELMNELEHQHNKLKEFITTLPESKYQEPIKWRFSKYMPTIMDLLVFMCISHESMHLGQLSAWRRAMQLPSALATL
ncbi:MAG: DinB family protein [Chitinophagales bacterium]|nr:DinB family protein [Chitinophagales bacterium]